MASDLPQMHRSPEAMARSLATYISCPDKVRSAVRECFGTSPCVQTIRRYREQHLRPVVGEPFKPHEGYHPEDASNKAAATSKVFLERIRRERELSAELARLHSLEAVAEVNLRSTFLTQQQLVNHKWDQAIDEWREAAE